MPTMLSASAIVAVGFVATQTDTDGAEFSANHLFYALRLIGALLVATVVPLLIDRRARRSSRISQ
jgi:hypothetical protein